MAMVCGISNKATFFFFLSLFRVTSSYRRLTPGPAPPPPPSSSQVRVLADSMAPGTTRWSFMSEASFSDSAAVEIADAVAGNPSVVALGFRNNIGIGPEGGKAIAAMLLANHFVEELDLYDTTIRDDGAEAIIAVTGRSSLRLLDIGKCGATEPSVRAQTIPPAFSCTEDPAGRVYGPSRSRGCLGTHQAPFENTS